MNIFKSIFPIRKLTQSKGFMNTVTVAQSLEITHSCANCVSDTVNIATGKKKKNPPKKTKHRKCS